MIQFHAAVLTLNLDFVPDCHHFDVSQEIVDAHCACAPYTNDVWKMLQLILAEKSRKSVCNSINWMSESELVN